MLYLHLDFYQIHYFVRFNDFDDKIEKAPGSEMSDTFGTSISNNNHFNTFHFDCFYILPRIPY